MNNEFYNESTEKTESTTPVGEETSSESKKTSVSPVSEKHYTVEAPLTNTPSEPEVNCEPKKEHKPEVNYKPEDSSQSPINMNYKPRKTPAWVIILVCVLGTLYLVFSIYVISSGFKDKGFRNFNGFNFFQRDQKSEFFNSTPSTEPSSDKPIEDHLIQSETPVSEGAKTTDGALTVKQISQKVRISVVGVIGQNSDSFSSSSVGSGIIMSSDGYIITNNHVIEGMTAISVVLDDGTTYDAKIIGTDAHTDLAVIKVEATDLVAAEFGNSDVLEQGDPAIAIGNPAGLQLQNTVTFGIISAINRDIIIEDRSMTLIQTDASINPGNSGGPLVNEFGQVIGINTIKVGISYYEGLGFAIPINTAKPIIDELITNGYIKGRPSIGINGQSISARDAAFYGLPEGLYIEYVHPNSDAYKKGLRRGDVITKMNGTKLSSTAEIKKIRDNFKAGDEVTLTIFRSGKEYDLKIILMDEAELSE